MPVSVNHCHSHTGTDLIYLFSSPIDARYPGSGDNHGQERHWSAIHESGGRSGGGLAGRRGPRGPSSAGRPVGGPAARARTGPPAPVLPAPPAPVLPAPPAPAPALPRHSSRAALPSRSFRSAGRSSGLTHATGVALSSSIVTRSAPAPLAPLRRSPRERTGTGKLTYTGLPSLDRPFYVLCPQ